ncbi:MAG: HD domain-containing protein [Sphaerochaeta sp.]|nr:HD domain-containing protein [Sphaerochaeta sp.]MCH3920888.1 HD domain-containing protein [Sphaerochaeta sp.]MCI2045217.1 HD domain-containing protein [Sphaerochaeta sp.]MCI2076665.1 HD domain-containing protein [Sphaerochaeta sp.]MCI2096698.1 HD domain-containing protein [Sphaerochaeta sp.]
MRFCNQLSDDVLKKRERLRTSDIRGDYYRDTTAIIHSSPFRRLKHKTQVFFAPSNDHICTRMEHCLHVASIASTICRGLGMDTELAWAIGMGHDLGHTPFGHTGERIISRLMEERGFPPFEHEVNSLRMVDFLADKGKGLNLTYAVRDGIVSHCGEHFTQSLAPDFTVKDLSRITSRKGLVPATWEAVVVRFSDSIAYLGRDFEDACRLGVIEASSLPALVKDKLGTTNGEIINSLVNDIIDSSDGTGIRFSDALFPTVLAMKDFNYQHIYQSDMLRGYDAYFSRLIRLVVDYLERLDREGGDNEAYYRQEQNLLALGYYRHRMEMRDAYLTHDGNLSRMVFDYVAGMSDNFCLDCADEILKPIHIGESAMGKWFDAR